MTAVSAITSSSGEAQSELVKYQQKLAADLAAKAAAKVITADRDAVTRAQQASLNPAVVGAAATASPAAASAGAAGTSLDVTV